MGLVGALGGCTAQPVSEGAWVFACLALVIVSLTGYVAGAWHSRLSSHQALREARRRARLLTRLVDAWLWRTDAQHALVTWQGPGQAAASRCALFEDAGLRAALSTEQAFGTLRVRTAQPVEGSLAWTLRAMPCFDSQGRFDGFAGIAEPVGGIGGDGHAPAQAAALAQALALARRPALALVHEGVGWHVLLRNEAAAALWPQAFDGAALSTLFASLPGALPAALEHAEAADVESWRLLPSDVLDGGVRVRLLVQAADDASGGADTAESESFSFTVSHDLRAPIRVVEGFTRIVKEDYGRLLDRVGNDHLDRVLGAAARMNLMIDALLTLARLSSQPLARQPVNLSQLAGYVVDDLRRAAPDRDAEVDIEPDLLTRGDPTLLRLVLENLLGNAWKYSARSPRAHIVLASVQHGGRTAYVVRDNGAGFDMRSADRLFGLFQRLHSASEFPGHGVGLASVKRIVRRHGGDIWAEADIGRGAAFYFTLAG
jgi:signal transduction histidine kinase